MCFYPVANFRDHLSSSVCQTLALVFRPLYDDTQIVLRDNSFFISTYTSVSQLALSVSPALLRSSVGKIDIGWNVMVLSTLAATGI